MLQRKLEPEPVVLAVISTWESAALLTGRIPTVTSLVRRLPRPARVLIVGAVVAWIADHFSVIGDADD